MLRIPSVNVVFPDPLSPATPMLKIQGDAAIVSLKFLCSLFESFKVMNQAPSCISILNGMRGIRILFLKSQRYPTEDITFFFVYSF
jgi:hypothetical protein